MKIITGSILMFFLITCKTMAQERIEFDIVFGNYINDHKKKEFRSKERKWSLKDEELIYLIDAHGRRYSDTITLKKHDIQLIAKFIAENNLSNSITKDLNKDYLGKLGWTVSVIGSIKIKNKSSNFDIRANSPSFLDEDSDALRLKKLEDLLYKIIEKY